MDDDNKKKAVDAAEIALVVTATAIGGPVGSGLSLAGTIAGKLYSSLERQRANRTARFLKRVGFYLEENDPAGAASFVADKAATDEFADVLERGFERMMKAYNPLAEECICLLTAEYLRLHEPIIRDFAACGDLLVASDTDTLSTLSNITSAYFEAYSDGNVGPKGILFDSSGIPKKTGPFFFIVNYVHDNKIISPTFESHTNLRRVPILMENHGLGRIPHVTVESAPTEMNQGNPQCEYYFGPEDDIPMKRLHSCLAPVRRLKDA